MFQCSYFNHYFKFIFLQLTWTAAAVQSLAGAAHASGNGLPKRVDNPALRNTSCLILAYYWTWKEAPSVWVLTTEGLSASSSPHCWETTAGWYSYAVILSLSHGWGREWEGGLNNPSFGYINSSGLLVRNLLVRDVALPEVAYGCLLILIKLTRSVCIIKQAVWLWM